MTVEPTRTALASVTASFVTTEFLHEVFELADARLHHPLLLAGGMVARVLAQAALLARRWTTPVNLLALAPSSVPHIRP